MRGTFAAMEEPGIDIAQWIAEWEALEEDVRDSPAESLSDLDDLVARMMTARGLALAERDGEDATEHEATREFSNARLITRQFDAGEDVDPGDIAYAVQAYRELYASLLEFGADRGAPA
jgi:hypothetical protein